MNTRDKPRFIAGAVCPRCAEMDRIVMYCRDGVYYRYCVNCDFEDSSRFEEPETDTEVPTRVNRPMVKAQAYYAQREKDKEAVQVVKILGPDSSDDSGDKGQD